MGVFHLRHPDLLVRITPPWVPWPHEVVLATGVCELLGAAGLLLRPTRRWAGAALALYAVCVFPANVHHALAHVDLPGLPSSWWYHAPRLAFQPVFVWWALWAGEVVDWPFGGRKDAGSQA